jgi:hypothetical protein
VIIAGSIIYYASKFTDVKPIQIAPEEIERRINYREEELHYKV